MLFPGGGHVVPAYVACAINGSGRTIIEFCCQRYRNVFVWYPSKSVLEPGQREAAECLARAMPIMAPMYDGIVKINGTAEFLVYEDTDATA